MKWKIAMVMTIILLSIVAINAYYNAEQGVIHTYPVEDCMWRTDYYENGDLIYYDLNESTMARPCGLKTQTITEWRKMNGEETSV